MNGVIAGAEVGFGWLGWLVFTVELAAEHEVWDYWLVFTFVVVTGLEGCFSELAFTFEVAAGPVVWGGGCDWLACVVEVAVGIEAGEFAWPLFGVAVSTAITTWVRVNVKAAVVNVNGCTVTVWKIVDGGEPVKVWVLVVVVGTTVDENSVWVTVTHPVHSLGQVASGEAALALRAIAALAVTAASVELEAFVAVLALEAAADVELGVIVGTTLLASTAPSVFTAADVEVEVTVTITAVLVTVTVPDPVTVTVDTIGESVVVGSFVKTVVTVVVEVEMLVAVQVTLQSLPRAARWQGIVEVVEGDVVEEDVVEGDVVEEDVVEEDVVEEDVVEEDVVEEDVVEDGVVEDGVVEDGVVEDDVVEEDIVKEDVVEEDVVEDGVVEDDVVEDDVVEDGVVEEDVVAEGVVVVVSATCPENCHQQTTWSVILSTHFRGNDKKQGWRALRLSRNTDTFRLAEEWGFPLSMSTP
jgi:hypothetical protein